MKYHVLAAFLTLAPAALAAQSTNSQVSGTAQATAQSQGKSPQARIDAAMRAAVNADIPTSLLSSKVAEGEAKRVPSDRIATAVEARLTALVRASSVLDRADVKAENAAGLAVSADALEAGVSENALIRLSKSAPDDRRVVAVAVLADLVRLGSSSEQALARVSAAVSTNAALANLNAQVATQLRLGGLSSTLDAVGLLKLQ